MSARVGVITSSEGHSLASFVEALSGTDVVFDVVTDRCCGAEQASRSLGIDCTRLEFGDRDAFSGESAEHFAQRGTEVVLLLFNRIVSEALYARVPCLNIHPALLPAFKGMTAIDEARQGLVRFLGATLHLVTGEVDGGPIVAQAVSPVSPEWPIESYQAVSFVQRVGLACVGVDLWTRGDLAIDATKGVARVNPGLTSDVDFNPALRDDGARQHIDNLSLSLKLKS